MASSRAVVVAVVISVTVQILTTYGIYQYWIITKGFNLNSTFDHNVQTTTVESEVAVKPDNDMPIEMSDAQMEYELQRLKIKEVLIPPKAKLLLII